MLLLVLVGMLIVAGFAQNEREQQRALAKLEKYHHKMKGIEAAEINAENLDQQQQDQQQQDLNFDMEEFRFGWKVSQIRSIEDLMALSHEMYGSNETVIFTKVLEHIQKYDVMDEERGIHSKHKGGQRRHYNPHGNHTLSANCIQYLEFVSNKTRTTDPQNEVTKIAFFRPTKCGTSTISGVMFRLGARHQLKIPPHFISVHHRDDVEYDMTFWHLPEGMMKHLMPSCMFPMFNTMLHNPFIWTIVREPKSHFISWYYFFKYPYERVHLADLDKFSHLHNPLSHDFGIEDTHQLKMLRGFDLICVLDRIDECLVLMKRWHGWGFRDITYLPLRQTQNPLNGSPVERLPTYESFTEHQQRHIHAATLLDEMVYKHAIELFDEAVAKENQDEFQRDVRQFRKINHEFQHVCKNHMAHPLCIWYSLLDDPMHQLIDENGGTYVVNTNGDYFNATEMVKEKSFIAENN